MVVSLSVAVADSLRNSTLVTRIDRSGDIDGILTGDWTAQGTFEFNTKTCGQFELAVDTIAPTHPSAPTSPLLVWRGACCPKVWRVALYLADNLAGLQSWEARLDGEWILFRWDPKRERIWYELTDGKHAMNRTQQLDIRVQDEVGNEAVWSGTVRFE